MNRLLFLRRLTLLGTASLLFSFPASCQQIELRPLLPPSPTVLGTPLSPNFRVENLRLDAWAPDGTADDATASDSASYAADSDHQQGFVKRSIKRIGRDQEALYLAPFEPHNLKWDAVVLVGTGAFLAADRHIENNLPRGHYTLYQTTSDVSIAGLAGSLAGIWIYGLKTGNGHAREMGNLEIETLINTFLIYTPMQLIAGRQRPGEGNGKGDFLKHHAINTSFPGGHAMFTWAMASVLADEYPKTWARVLSYGAAFSVTFTRFLARDHWSSDMYLGAGLGLAIAENTFHSHCDPQYESQCKHHQWWWKAVKIQAP